MLSVRLVFVGAVLYLAACDARDLSLARVEADRRDHSRVRAEVARLGQDLDALEARLHGGRSRVHHWADLAARHGEVSQLACRNLGEQADALANLQRRERRRPPAPSFHRVAEGPVPAVVTDAHVSGFQPARAPVPASSAASREP